MAETGRFSRGYARAVSDTSPTAPPEGEAPLRLAHDQRAALRAREKIPRAERVHGYRIEVEGLGPLRCGEIRGFHEAARAAREPRAPAPTQLVLLAPEGDGWSDLDAWAEDVAQVRRRVTIERCTDGRAIVVIATLSVYGRGMETALSLESIAAAPPALASPLTRSGVHRLVDVAAALAVLAARAPDDEEEGDAHAFCFGACCREKG